MEMIGDSLSAQDVAKSALILPLTARDLLHPKGKFISKCFDRNGLLKWEDEIENTVMTQGKNIMLDAGLAGSAYTVVGPFMWLMSSVSYSAISAADTPASHAGWLEAGGTNAPAYTGNRQTIAWSAASAGSKAMSAALSYVMTGNGTIKGLAIGFGTSASATKDTTTGSFWSAGLYTGGDRAVLSGDTVQNSYSVGM